MRDEQTGLSNAQRLAVVVGAIVVLVVGYLVIQGGGSDKRERAASTPAPSGTTSASTGTSSAPAASTPIVRVAGGKPQGGVKRLTFSKGDRIRFRVVSDTASEIHVHGYDLKEDVAKGGQVTFSFPGSIDGRFVVELEGPGVQIAELDVQP